MTLTGIILIVILLVVAVELAFLMTGIAKGKDQIIIKKDAELEELKIIRTALVKELEEEQLRTKAIAQIYDELWEEHDNLYTITVRNIFEPKDKKFLTLDKMTNKLKVVNA
jgi:ferritin